MLNSLCTLCRDIFDSNEQHDHEVCAARDAAEEDMAKCTGDIIQHVDSEFNFIKTSSIYHFTGVNIQCIYLTGLVSYSLNKIKLKFLVT